MSDESTNVISVLELTNGERKFLHNLSNKLLVVQGMSKTVLKKLEGPDQVSDKEIDRLKKVVKASSDMIDLLQDRRSLLHEVCRAFEEEEP